MGLTKYQDLIKKAEGRDERQKMIINSSFCTTKAHTIAVDQ